MRSTSRTAFNSIKSNGLLSARRFAVYETLFEHGPLTQGETWKYHFPLNQRHDIGPRFAELEHRGVIKCVEERPCRVTGRLAMVWDVTEGLPVEVAKIEMMKCPCCNGRGKIRAEEFARLTRRFDESTGQGDLGLGVL